MSGDKLLASFAAKVATPPGREESEPATPEDLGAFGWLRGHERAIMLELRLKNGNLVALGYAWLERVDFDRSGSVTLIFTGHHAVRVTGRNLNRDVRPNMSLLSGLGRHKVPWIQEADESTALSADQDVVIVERIEVE